MTDLSALTTDFLKRRSREVVDRIEVLANEIEPVLREFDSLKSELKSITEELEKRYEPKGD